VAWFYEIRDSNNAVMETGKGFATLKAAMAAGRKRARELKASGSLPGSGVGTVGAGHDSEKQLGKTRPPRGYDVPDVNPGADSA
jgi:hypothetical protein